jgi:hypothetical protein
MAVTNLTPPVISGTARVGFDLSTTNGTWTSDDPLGYSYRWLRCDSAGANCNAIGGAVLPSYRCVTADVGSRLRSEVTAIEQVGPPPGETYLNSFSELTSPFGDTDTFFYLQRWKGTSWTSKYYTGTPWPDGGGIFQETSSQGLPAFRFKAGGSMPMGSGSGVQNAAVNYGYTWDITGKIMFPAAGNPNGFQTFSGDWNALWEFCDGSHEIWNQFGVDATSGTPKIYCRTYNGSGGVLKGVAAAPIVYGTHHDWRWRVKAAKDGTGYAQFWFDGVQILNRSGSTLDGSWNMGLGWFQWGWYGDSSAHKNEVIYSGITAP